MQREEQELAAVWVPWVSWVELRASPGKENAEPQ